MNIVQRYLGLGIEGYTPSDLLKIFNGDHKVKIKYASGGIVTLDNGAVVKCVSHYYVNPTKTSAASKSKKVSNSCFYIQKDFGVSTVGNYQCVNCHRECIELCQDNAIIRR